MGAGKNRLSARARSGGHQARRRPLYRAATDAETATRSSRPPPQPSGPSCRSIPSYLSTRELPEVQANGLWRREAACKIRREVGGPASLFTGLAHEEVSSVAASTVTRCLTLESASHKSENARRPRTTTTFLLENATSMNERARLETRVERKTRLRREKERKTEKKRGKLFFRRLFRRRRRRFSSCSLFSWQVRERGRRSEGDRAADQLEMMRTLQELRLASLPPPPQAAAAVAMPAAAFHWNDLNNSALFVFLRKK